MIHHRKPSKHSLDTALPIDMVRTPDDIRLDQNNIEVRKFINMYIDNISHIPVPLYIMKPRLISRKNVTWLSGATHSSPTPELVTTRSNSFTTDDFSHIERDLAHKLGISIEGKVLYMLTGETSDKRSVAASADAFYTLEEIININNLIIATDHLEGIVW